MNKLRRSGRLASCAASAALKTPRRRRNATQMFTPMEVRSETVVVGKRQTRKRKMVDTSVSNKRPKVEEAQVMEEEKEEYPVGKILGHTIASEIDFEACGQNWKGSKDEIAFKVKWRGTSEITWEPLRNLYENSKLQQYMCENLIPTIGRTVGTHKNRIKVSFVFVEPVEDQWYYLDGLYDDEVNEDPRTTHTKQTAIRSPKIVAPIPEKRKPAKKPRNAQRGRKITQNPAWNVADPTDLFGGAPYADDLEEPFTYTTDIIFQTVDATPVPVNRRRGRLANANRIPVATRGRGRKAAPRNSSLEAASSTPGTSRSQSITSLSGQRITRAKAADALRRAEAEKEKSRKLTSFDDDLEELFAEEAEAPNADQISAEQEIYYESPDGAPMEEGQVYVDENSGDMMLFDGQNLVPYEDPTVYQFSEDEQMMNQPAETVEHEPAPFDYDSDPMLCGNFEDPVLNDLEPIFNFASTESAEVENELLPQNSYNENFDFQFGNNNDDDDIFGNLPSASQSYYLDNNPTSPTFNPFSIFGENDASALFNQIDIDNYLG